ncbi:EAL domain-containing protein [Mariprofundus erugo]|uniref:EAL domain-containing protein n=2 Tax=Mariprofundus erugo TaxID=2528639 RepID=A0A5R9GMT3_9PROT|nr:EAL domain-containing protein [Mariprofundus erugo]TLS67671.1 EAL domain-containing protein [Mariprofundus erugo]TLS76211.1 EAL domain-containing protein [Mariprofundus erugo]
MTDDSLFSGIEFTHAFQPIVDMDTGQIVSYEVLLRGKCNESPGAVFGKVTPAKLMLFDQLSREKALVMARNLGISCRINLNFTPGAILFENGRYVHDTMQAAVRLGMHTSQLVIEITESECIHDIKHLVAVLNDARREQFTIAIDDFGSGYAGLNMLAEIQPDIIKLDMSLLRDIELHGPRQSIVRAIIQVCLELGIDPLAEGVESEAEFNFLRQTGISLFQGYLFAKPGFECLPEVSLPPG